MPLELMPSFLTGSHAYGIPTEESDIDVVMLVSREMQDTLWQLQDNAERYAALDNDDIDKYGEGFSNLKFGRLNLVLCRDRGLFEVWKAGTRELVRIAQDKGPVTRDEAVELLSTRRREYRKSQGIVPEKKFSHDTPPHLG